jgi:hypothetical protein
MARRGQLMVVMAAVLMLATMRAAEAQVDTSRDVEAALADASRWTIQLEPMAWYSSPSGRISMPGGGDKVRVERLNLDTPMVTPYGEVHVNLDSWRLSFSGGGYASDREFAADSSFTLGNVAVSSGDPVELDFDFLTAEASAGYRLYFRDFAKESKNPENATAFELALYVLGGARVYDVGLDVTNVSSGASVSSDEFYIEPLVGGRAELEIAEDFTIDLQLSGGAMPLDEHSSASLDVAVSFTWRPVEHVGVTIGWRQVAYWLSDGSDADEFEYDGRIAGVFGGVTIRF